MQRNQHARPVRKSLDQRALEHVGQLVEQNRQDAGGSECAAADAAIKSVGIVGAGTMGVSIAAALAKQAVPVVITDNDRRVLAAVHARMTAELAAEMSVERAQECVDRCVQVDIALGPVLRCDLVLEAIVESFAAKSKLFGEIEPQLPPTTILATNTSTIPVGRLAAGLANPDRFCGIHYCHPVRQRPLVEIVCGPKTGAATVATAVAHVKSLGRMPIVVHDGPGFLINRLLLPYLGEGLGLLLEGVPPRLVERAATDFGMALGPLRLLDEIGLDTTLEGGWNLIEAFPERVAASPLLVTLVKHGRMGRKAGAGFFVYPDPAQPDETADAFTTRQTQADRALDEWIAEWAKPAGRHTPHSVTMRLLLPMLLEATRVLEENKVRGPGDVDLAAIFGLGFPASKGGLLWWADTMGPARIMEMLRPMQPIGPRVQPTPLLCRLAREAGRFYRG